MRSAPDGGWQRAGLKVSGTASFIAVSMDVVAGAGECGRKLCKDFLEGRLWSQAGTFVRVDVFVWRFVSFLRNSLRMCEQIGVFASMGGFFAALSDLFAKNADLASFYGNCARKSRFAVIAYPEGVSGRLGTMPSEAKAGVVTAWNVTDESAT
jgi:hypothetical protein